MIPNDLRRLFKIRAGTQTKRPGGLRRQAVNFAVMKVTG